MIRRLRSRHRWMVLTLAVVVGVLMILGLRARRAVPTVPDLPGAAAGTSAAASDQGGARR